MTEGELHLKAAAKALKTNPWAFKFRADYETAALEFADAAKCFQSAGQHTRAVQALRDFAQIRAKESDMFGAGRGYENVANSCQNFLSDFQASCVALNEAAECYVQAGKSESACRVWLKVADIQENKLNQYSDAASTYRKCLELNEIEDKDHNIADVLKPYVGLLCRRLSTDLESELMSALDRQIDIQIKLNQVRCHNLIIIQSLSLSHYYFFSFSHLSHLYNYSQDPISHQIPSFQKTVLCKVVLRLHKNDHIAANNELDHAVTLSPSFLESKELNCAQNLIAAWDSGDAEEFKKLLSSSVVTYLPVEFAKLAKQLNPPKAVANRLPQKTSAIEDTSEDATPEDVAELLM